MTEQFILATANPDKVREITAVLADAGVDIELLPRPTTVPDVDETGDTLEDNARLKAEALCVGDRAPGDRRRHRSRGRRPRRCAGGALRAVRR